MPAAARQSAARIIPLSLRANARFM